MIIGSTLAGLAAGIYLRRHGESLREPFGVLQAALLGLVALILAFGLTLAVGRYENAVPPWSTKPTRSARRYLRAQTLAEPNGARPSRCCAPTQTTSIQLSHEIPGSTAARTTIASER